LPKSRNSVLTFLKNGENGLEPVVPLVYGSKATIGLEKDTSLSFTSGLPDFS
jgi:hypothetical protein